MAEVRDLNVWDVLGLLESPQEEVYQEVRALLKDTLCSVKEAWLVNGLLDYFYDSHSGRLLDLLLGVSEPHDRHLLDRLLEGLKGGDRFRHTCILLYAVQRRPPPTWLRKFLQHGAMRELLHVLATGEDVPVLVGALMVVVILLPTLPLEMGRDHLSSILDIFCRLVHLTPRKDVDDSFQPFLQVAVYSLFHRLYALYPCHLLTCLRTRFTKPSSSACFFTTLKPMMEKVRFHPLLITENRETELQRNRWRGLETHQLIKECAKLCLDPVEATCEEVCGSFFSLSTGNHDMLVEVTPVPTNWLLNATENNFWSPSLATASPRNLPTPQSSLSSQPQTPVFPISSQSLKLGGSVAESPPEAAIEATPETTPFTSPIKVESNLASRRPNTATAACALPLLTGRVEPSTVLSSKLQQILKEQQQIQKENREQQEHKVEGDSSREVMGGGGRRLERQNSGAGSESDQVGTSEARTVMTDNVYRMRKMSMYDGTRSIDLNQLEIHSDQLTNGNTDLDFEKVPHIEFDSENGFKSSLLNRRISEEKESEGNDSRRSSDETAQLEEEMVEEEEEEEEETGRLGLGVPSHRSMTDLVKNMRTMRLRFLSQCGPPPDLSQYNMGSSVRAVVSPTKPLLPSFKIHEKCSSCPDLSLEAAQLSSSLEGRIRKESAVSSLTLSPIRQPVVSEASTQTEEITVINPYEQLLGALMGGQGSSQPARARDVPSTTADPSAPSPHQLLDEYLTLCCKVDDEGKSLMWQPMSSPQEGLRNRVRLMQVMLLMERYKRDVHAERNRRLLGCAKREYALQELQEGLKEKVAQLEGEVAHLKNDLFNLQVKRSTKEEQLQTALLQQQENISQVLAACEEAQQERDVLKLQCSSLTKENEKLNSQLQTEQSKILEKDRHIAVNARLSEENQLLRNQVEVLNKQVCLMGEVQEQYKGEVWRLSVGGTPGVTMVQSLEQETALRQVQELEEKYRAMAASLDAEVARITQLEAEVEEKSRRLEEQQREVRGAREAGAERCRVVELRCQALANTNQTLESFILQQNDKIDRLVRQIRRSQRGKSVCSDGIDVELELSASPSSISGSSSMATSPPEDPLNPPGPLMARQPLVLNNLDRLVGLDLDPDPYPRTKS